LADRLERSGALPWQELLRIMVPVLSAVGTAHAAGVIHRDLKPDNIFLSQLGDSRTEPIVFDFGICKLSPTESLVGNTSALTETGFMMGTPAYMAPEQVYAEADLDARADVWALGVILYECATGKRPVEGESLGQMIKVITSGPITPIEQVAPHLPPQLSELINRMLKHNRKERPMDLREPFAVLRALLPVSDQSGSASNWLAPSISRAPTTAADPSAISRRPRSPSGVATPLLASESEPGPRGSTAKTILIGLLAVTALGFSSALLLLRGHAAPPAPASSVYEHVATVPAEPAAALPPTAEIASAEAATIAPAPSTSAPHKHKRAPDIIGGFQSFNTGRK
jgi:serine/threonine protein kinase